MFKYKYMYTYTFTNTYTYAYMYMRVRVYHPEPEPGPEPLINVGTGTVFKFPGSANLYRTHIFCWKQCADPQVFFLTDWIPTHLSMIVSRHNSLVLQNIWQNLYLAQSTRLFGIHFFFFLILEVKVKTPDFTCKPGSLFSPRVEPGRYHVYLLGYHPGYQGS